MHIMNNFHVLLDNEGYVKILEAIEVSEAYKTLKETFLIKLQESLLNCNNQGRKGYKKNDPSCPFIFMKRSW